MSQPVTAAKASAENAAAALPTVSAQCQIERAGTARGPQNVGERLTLSCQGDFGHAMAKTAQVKAPEGGEYSLYILEVIDSTPQNLKAVVTSYRAGQHQNEAFDISDGQIIIRTTAQNFTVESVIDPNAAKNGQPPKPFPSVGPFVMSYPLWFWLIISAVVVAVVALFSYLFYRRQRRVRLMAELEKYMTMLSPFNQFSKDARANVKRMNAVSDDNAAADLVKKLDEDFRLFLIRELKVPALQVSNKEVLKEIKTRHRRVYEDSQAELRRLLFEFEKARRDQTRVKVKDCEELLFLSRQVADRINSMRRQSP